MPATRKLPSGRWQARFRDRDGKVKAVPGGQTYPDQGEALTAAVLFEHSVRSGPRRRDGKLTWGTWCEEWWPTRTVGAATLEVDAGRRDKHLIPKWSDVFLVDINRHDIRAWAATLGRPGLAAATVQRIVHLLSASLAGAVDAELLGTNPAARLKLPPARLGVERYLTREEFDSIADELAGPHLLMLKFLAFTGTRFGEAAGLHWNRVDLVRGTVQIVEALNDRQREINLLPKGKKIRDLPLPDELLELMPLSPRAGRMTCGLPHTEGNCRAPVVLAAPEGGVWDARNFRRAFYRAVEMAGVEHARIHDLRHTYASWLVQDGIDLRRAGHLLGHVSPITTDRYAHLEVGRHEDVLKVLNRRSSPEQDTVRRAPRRVV